MESVIAVELADAVQQALQQALQLHAEMAAKEQALADSIAELQEKATALSTEENASKLLRSKMAHNHRL